MTLLRRDAAAVAAPSSALEITARGSSLGMRSMLIAAAVAVALAIPFIVKSFLVFQLTLVMVYGLAILGLNLLTGFNGQFSLGHSAFYGIGAYTAAILMDRADLAYFWTSPCAGAVCFAVGFLFGFPALRLQGLYLALATFALATAMPQILKSPPFEPPTGSVQGIVILKPDPPPGVPLDADQWLYFFTLAVLLAMFAGAANLVKSRTGRAIMAIRDHPIAAAAMGLNTALYKTLTFGVSAFYTGVAGALGAIAIQFVAPDSFHAKSAALRTEVLMTRISRRSLLVTVPAAVALAGLPARAEKKHGPGVTDTEIKIGNTGPYSGPASSYGTIGKAEAAYFRMLNDQGGVNRRKINFISYDDAYTPPKTVEQVRKLVEEDGVLLMLAPLGTPTNSAIQRYLNQKKVPQLFVATGATKWNDPTHFPWTMGWQPNYQSEGHVYAAYILEHRPNGKVAILYQNDDFGKDYLKGLRDGLGDKAKSMIIVEAPYETTDPTVDSQIISMKSAGADIFVNTGIPKFAAQAIRKAAEIGWKPLHIISSVGNSVGATLKPAGLENATDIVSDFYLKDPTDPQWKDDPGYQQWIAFMDKYYPEGDKTDLGNVIGPCFCQTLVQVLKQCGDDLTLENIMKQAASLHDFAVPMLLPGIKINTSATDFAPIKQIQMARFDGERWKLLSPVLSGDVHG